ncbi:MAG: dienelactone hydrolase family protein [Acidimicrobiia bacterium]
MSDSEPSRRRTSAPSGDLATYQRESFEWDGRLHDVYRRGHGPAVIVITEIPGISPMVVGFADRVVAMGCTAVLPDLFGVPGKDPMAKGKLGMITYTMSSLTKVCISREFTAFAAGKSSPIVSWLNALATKEHERCGGPGVGVVGMCLTGGFALAMATNRAVIAPVLSQPALPFPVSKRHRRSIDSSDATIASVADRCAAEGLQVLGLRFNGDPTVPADRFAMLRERLGDGFVAVELDQRDGNPTAPMSKHHSVLTVSLVDEPGEPTRRALDAVLDLFRHKLLEEMTS